jgi:hypothetical protein
MGWVRRADVTCSYNRRATRMTIAMCVGAVLFTFSALAQDEAMAAKKTAVLIIDGDWPRATAILKAILQDSGLFTVEVSTTPAKDAPADTWNTWRPEFAKCHVIVSNFNGGHQPRGTRWPADVEQAFKAYVKNGGGFVSYHAANNAFLNWPAYNEMIGLGWRTPDFRPLIVIGPDEKMVTIPTGQGRKPGHGPEHDFVVTTLDASQPITKGLPKKWVHGVWRCISRVLVGRRPAGRPEVESFGGRSLIGGPATYGRAGGWPGISRQCRQNKGLTPDDQLRQRCPVNKITIGGFAFPSVRIHRST